MFGFLFATVALVLAIFALTLKIIFWDLFPIGIIPILLLQLFGTGSVMLSLGVIGEYVGGTYTQSLGRKRVYEKERLNF